jgi:hypothetical protein
LAKRICHGIETFGCQRRPTQQLYRGECVGGGRTMAFDRLRYVIMFE